MSPFQADDGTPAPAVQDCAFVLDDEPLVAALVCRFLGDAGLRAEQFSGSTEFLARVATDRPGLLVLDLALGETDAVDIMHHLERIGYDGHILLISGRDETTLGQIAKIGERHGFAMLAPLKKPFRAADIQRRLADMGEAPAGRHEPRPVRPAAAVDDAFDLADALATDRLELWYQPKIALATQTVCGAEALLRGYGPDGRVVLPARILPPPGDPLFHALSRFVVARAMMDWRLLADRGHPLKLAVNIPASFMRAPAFVDTVRQMLPKDPQFPGLIIEVTEDEIIGDPQSIHEIATQLKLYDISISIDDFGTAHASLSRLIELPCVELKIDRSFVDGCSGNRAKRILCQTVIDLAHRFGATVCAEGVETAADLHALLAMGCNTAQGYLFARPMPRERFAAMLAANAGGTVAFPLADAQPERARSGHHLS